MGNNSESQIKQDDSKEMVIELDAVLKIADVKTLSERLDKALEAKRDYVLNASQVETLDTATLQLLVAFVRQIRCQGTAVRWEATSAALRKGAALLDLEQHLELTITAEDTAAACRPV